MSPQERMPQWLVRWREKCRPKVPAVVGRRFRLFGFPLRIRGGHGASVRAVAILRD